METEKVCVNLSAAELGRLDVLVAEGVYVNRTDAVRAALRREFEAHREVIDRHLDAGEDHAGRTSRSDKIMNAFTGIGFAQFSAAFLEECAERGERIQVVGAGIFTFEDDVTPDLADRTVYRLRVLGSVRGPKQVLDRIADRIHRGVR